MKTKKLIIEKTLTYCESRCKCLTKITYDILDNSAFGKTKELINATFLNPEEAVKIGYNSIPIIIFNKQFLNKTSAINLILNTAHEYRHYYQYLSSLRKKSEYDLKCAKELKNYIRYNNNNMILYKIQYLEIDAVAFSEIIIEELTNEKKYIINTEKNIRELIDKQKEYIKNSL